jgi:hypothetical protein
MCLIPTLIDALSSAGLSSEQSAAVVRRIARDLGGVRTTIPADPDRWLAVCDPRPMSTRDLAREWGLSSRTAYRVDERRRVRRRGA